MCLRGRRVVIAYQVIAGVVMGKYLVLVAVAILAGCAGRQLAMPEYVSTAADAYGNTYIDRVDLSFAASVPVTFSALKMCVAENTDTDEVQLRDSSVTAHS